MGRPRPLNDEQEARLIALWPDRANTKLLCEEFGRTTRQMNALCFSVRERLKRHDDDRWKLLYRKSPDAEPVIDRRPIQGDDPNKNYGNVKRPDLEEVDTDPRPVWLVVTSARFITSEMLRKDREGYESNSSGTGADGVTPSAGQVSVAG